MGIPGLSDEQSAFVFEEIESGVGEAVADLEAVAWPPIVRSASRARARGLSPFLSGWSRSSSRRCPSAVKVWVVC